MITIFVGFFYAYPITFTQKMIDELSGYQRWSFVLIYILLYMLCRIIGCTLDFLGAILSKHISNILSKNLKRRFLKHFYEVTTEYVYTEKFEKIYALYENDISEVAYGICGPILYFSSSVSLFMWSSATLVRIRWELAVIYIIAALLIVLLTLQAGGKVKKLQNEIRPAQEQRMNIAKRAIEQYMKLLIMGYSDIMIDQSTQAEEKYNRLQYRETRVSSAKTWINDIIYYLAGACVWLIGSIYILRADMTTGEIVAFISFAGLIISPIVRFSSQWISVQKVLVSKRRIDGFFTLETNVGECSQVENYERGNLDVESISFGYEADSQVFTNFSCRLDLGKIYSLQGSNGCGKSTLFKLICRIYDNYEGKILYAGRDIRNLSRAEFYKRIAYEDESPIVICGSLYDNLTLGIENPDPDEVLGLASQIGLLDSLGLGYSLDYVLEQGEVQLSNGQKQMIGVIRNLLSHKNILILDESFSGISYPVVERIMTIYREYCSEYESIMIFVSHNIEHHALADEKICMGDL